MIRLFDVTLEAHVEMLAERGLLDKMYNAIDNGGTSEAVMAALDITRQLNLKPQIIEQKKDLQKCLFFKKLASSFRNERALKYYNAALLHIPATIPENEITRIMSIIYYQRAILSMQLGATSKSLKDFELISTDQCPPDILRSLQNKCHQIVPKELSCKASLTSTFDRKYFKFSAKRNKCVPCASLNISIVRENGLPKVVAAKDIPVGELVAIETAFVAQQNKYNRNISCYNCFTFTPNLIPCEGCCYVMFCNESCRKQSMEGCHKIECQLMDILECVATTTKCKLSVKTALKIKQMSKSWKDVVVASHNIGTDRMMNSSDEEIFDSYKPQSILSYNDDKHYVHGKIFNQSFVFAIIIDRLCNIPDYFPTDDGEKFEAMKALGRIMLHLYVTFPSEFEIRNVACEYTAEHQLVNGTLKPTVHHRVTDKLNPNFGIFSFASKLKHSCDANLYKVGLNKKIGLIAAKPIKKGTELTVSFLNYWFERIYTKEERNISLIERGLICNCRFCNEKSFLPNTELSAKQERMVRQWQTLVSTTENQDRKVFQETCNTLAALDDVSHTVAYAILFNAFRNNILRFQFSNTQNTVFSE
ncbi:SET and MYND domain-containing protein 4-like [Galleria mellonella]|uniref:SET and MYND domain-containing protein 4-like n=1 Tax=Galleria mellonella TaxID=7137 RepID=A0A6J3C679_GALME|nr:SET and MYND domain-containing protein 4-like [Galleria mellonella]